MHEDRYLQARAERVNEEISKSLMSSMRGAVNSRMLRHYGKKADKIDGGFGFRHRDSDPLVGLVNNRDKARGDLGSAFGGQGTLRAKRQQAKYILNQQRRNNTYGAPFNPPRKQLYDARGTNVTSDYTSGFGRMTERGAEIRPTRGLR